MDGKAPGGASRPRRAGVEGGRRSGKPARTARRGRLAPPCASRGNMQAWIWSAPCTNRRCARRARRGAPILGPSGIFHPHGRAEARPSPWRPPRGGTRFRASAVGRAVPRRRNGSLPCASQAHGGDRSRPGGILSFPSLATGKELGVRFRSMAPPPANSTSQNPPCLLPPFPQCFAPRARFPKVNPCLASIRTRPPLPCAGGRVPLTRASGAPVRACRRRPRGRCRPCVPGRRGGVCAHPRRPPPPPRPRGRSPPVASARRRRRG